VKTINSSQKFQKKTLVNVDEELFFLIKKIELNYGLSWDEARNSVNISIKNLSVIDNQ
jgi:hypothetical protein